MTTNWTFDRCNYQSSAKVAPRGRSKRTTETAISIAKGPLRLDVMQTEIAWQTTKASASASRMVLLAGQFSPR